MDLLQAKALAERRLIRVLGDSVSGIHFYDERTIKKPYGWVFFYTSKDFLLSGNPLDGPVGVGPIVVNSALGSTEILGTALRYTHYLKEYEKSMGLDI